MVKTKTATHKAKKVHTVVRHRKETDGTFFLKLVLFMVLSSLWLRIEYDDGTILPLPVGALIAIFYALHDHFQIDRKIELALILVAMFISFWLPIGIYLNL